MTEEDNFSDGSAEVNEEFVTLFQQHEKQLKGYLYAVTGESISSEDIFQEALLEAWKKFEQLKDKKKFGGWVATIAIRKYYKMLRDMVRERNQHEKYIEEREQSHEDNGFDEDIFTE